MIFQEDQFYFIRGIVSLTIARKDSNLCDSEEYVVFTDVAKYLSWIEENAPEWKRSTLKLGKIAIFRI